MQPCSTIFIVSIGKKIINRAPAARDELNCPALTAVRRWGIYGRLSAPGLFPTSLLRVLLSCSQIVIPSVCNDCFSGGRAKTTANRTSDTKDCDEPRPLRFTRYI